MAKKRRRRYSGAEKVAILKRHLVDHEDVSAICDELKLHPTVFYEWQKKFFENGVRAFEAEEKGQEALLRDKVSRLEAKLTKKDSALAELLEEHIALKKNLGEL